MDHPSPPSEIVIETAQGLEECCARLAESKVFGFDTEFVGEDSYHPQLCLVQVATPQQLFLIDPLAIPSLDPFWLQVVNPDNLVVMHAARQEVRLCQLFAGKPPGNLFDLQIAAGLVGLPYPMGHAGLVHQLLGIQITKAETLTEWRNRPLAPEQIRYAFDDVRFLLRLFQRLHDRLQTLERIEWAQEEFSQLAADSTDESPMLEKWRRLRGLSGLDRRQLAIVRQLNQWREGVAAQLNRPPRTIVRDDLLVEIARRAPTRDRELQIVRGLAKRFVPGILEAVRKAQGLPWDQCPDAIERDQDAPQAGLLTNILQAVLGNLCARQQITPSLVANQQDVRLLVRARLRGLPVSAESALAQGWRERHLLPELLAVLDGQRSLRIADYQADAPIVIEPTGAAQQKSPPQ